MFRKERCHVHFGTPDGVFLLPPPRETGCGHGFQAAAGRLQDGADHLRCSPVVHLLIGVKGVRVSAPTYPTRLRERTHKRL